MTSVAPTYRIDYHQRVSVDRDALSRFHILSRLGTGSSGVVHAAYDRIRGLHVALKQLRKVDPGRIYRFKREFRALSDLSHPNIVALYDLVNETEQWFLSMELIRGVDLMAYLQYGDKSHEHNTAEDSTNFGTGSFTTTSFVTTDVTAEAEQGSSPPDASAGDPLSTIIEDDVLSTRIDSTDVIHTTWTRVSTDSAPPLQEDSQIDSERGRDSAVVLPRAATPKANRLKSPPSRARLHRIRASFGQLANAVAALHRIGIVHCDLKPSNILITRSGRLVLVDFGIITELMPAWSLQHGAIRDHTGQILDTKQGPRKRAPIFGTPAFMAPEQTMGQTPGPAADWYAFGAILYFALTDRLPFLGTVPQVMRAKRANVPPSPAQLVPGLPDDLVALCMNLLSTDPTERYEGEEVRRRLAAHDRTRPTPTGVGGQFGDQFGDQFIGREDALSALHHAYCRARQGRLVFAVVRGLSGMGKTMLVERFLERIDGAASSNRIGEPARRLLLQGRCHERETLPYKGFDSIVDQVSAHLAEAHDGDKRAIIDTIELDALCQLFPVFSHLDRWYSGASPIRPTATTAPSMDLRQRAIAALAHIVCYLADTREVIVRIEDLQWADDDSLDLLTHLVEQVRDQHLLIIATIRTYGVPGDRALDQPSPHLGHVRPEHHRCAADHALAALAARRDIHCDLQWIDVVPLSSDEQRQLFLHIAGKNAPTAREDIVELAQTLAEQSGGHPMLITELARYSGRISSTASAPPRVEDVLWQRIVELPKPARALLFAVAIAGEPTDIEPLATAAGISPSQRERALTILQSSRLVRAWFGDKRAAVDAYHDKIRETIDDHIASERARALHSALAAALHAASCTDDGKPAVPPARLARHHQAAGEHAQASALYLKAARLAQSQLAFEHAIVFYSQVLELTSDDDGQKADAAHAQQRCQAYIGRAEALRIFNRADEALADLVEAETLAQACAEPDRQLATIFYLRGGLLFPRGDIDGCTRAHNQARHYARKAGSPEAEAKALSGLADVYYMKGQVVTSNRYFDDCIKKCQAHGLEEFSVGNLSMRGLTHFYCLRIPEALKDMDDSLEMACRLGQKRAEVIIRAGILPLTYLDIGRIDRAKREARMSMELARANGMPLFEADGQFYYARALVCLGRWDEARQELEQALAMARASSLAFVGPMILGLLARLARSDVERRRYYEEGLELLRKGAPCHNHFYFHRDAIDLALVLGDWRLLEKHATAIVDYVQGEDVQWVTYFADRGRALGRYLQGERHPALMEELTRLHDQAAVIPATRGNLVRARNRQPLMLDKYGRGP